MKIISVKLKSSEILKDCKYDIWQKVLMTRFKGFMCLCGEAEIAYSIRFFREFCSLKKKIKALLYKDKPIES